MDIDAYLQKRIDHLHANAGASLSDDQFGRALSRAFDLCRFPNELILYVFVLIMPLLIPVGWYFWGPKTQTSGMLVVLLCAYLASGFIFEPIGKALCKYLTVKAIVSEVHREVDGRQSSVFGYVMSIPAVLVALLIIYAFIKF